MDVTTKAGMRCDVCRCFLEPEDLFCANCGTENRQATALVSASEQPGSNVGQHVAVTSIASVFSFQCDGCGASMSYDASAKALRCPFCGSTHLTEQRGARTLKPESVLQLQIDRADIERRLREWLAKGFWRPGDTATASVIGSATLVYVPFWSFSATTRTNWTGDQSPPPVRSRADWYAINGEHRGSHEGILVAASSVLATAEIETVLPFDWRSAQSPNSVDLTNEVVEDFRLTRSDARMLARNKIQEAEARQCQQYFHGRSRNLRLNVEIADMVGRTLLAPIWIMVYHYSGKQYRVLINGQTGKMDGSTPVSVAKISIAVLIVVAIIILIIIVFASNALSH